MTIAQIAIKAAKMRYRCGRYAAGVWYTKHGLNCGYYWIALQLEAEKRGVAA